MTVALVFGGGMIGGMLRLMFTRLLPPLWGTFTANMVACAVLAWATANNASPLFLGAGLAGALSTWSTLAKEVGSLPCRRAIGYLVLTVACGAAVVRLFS